MFVSAHHRKVEPPPSGIIRNGLQSRWPMDEGSGTLVGDDQGSNDGTMVRMDENAWVAGIGIGPYSLDFLESYTNPYVSCGNVIPANANAATLCCRVFPRDISQISLVDNGGNTGNLIYRLSFGSGGTIQILIGEDDGTWGLVWTTACAPLLDTNQHVGFTWDGAIVRCYLNGIEEETEPYSGSLKTDGTGNCSIGNLGSPNNSWRFRGVMDDVRIYSRALTPAEMLSISNGTG